MRNGLRPKVIEYQEAFDKFVAGRKEINTAIEQGKIGDVFGQLLEKAEKHDAVAMDIIAYYYKSGIVNYLKENYIKEDKNIKEAIEKTHTWVCGDDDEYYYLQYLDGVLISYKTGCSASNEYIGESYEILKIKA